MCNRHCYQDDFERPKRFIISKTVFAKVSVTATGLTLHMDNNTHRNMLPSCCS